MLTSMTTLAAPHQTMRFSEAVRWIGFFLLSVYAVGFSKYWLGFDDLVGPGGQPFGHDFYCFWTASNLVLSGNLETVLNPEAFQLALDNGLPGQVAIYPWNYPPTYLLIVTPLALLPLWLSYFVFMGGTFAAFYWALRRFFPRPEVLWLLLLSGIPSMNMAYGQNGFLTAALMAVALKAVLDRQVIIAGLALGLLTFKPHLGLLIPVALLAARQYKMIISAALSTFGFAALAALAFGPEAWMAFFNATFSMSGTVAEGGLPWWHQPTVYGMMRGMGFDGLTGTLVQGGVSLAMVAMIWQVWRKSVSPIGVAILMPASILASPYLLVYDLMAMSICAIVWARLAIENDNWRPYERFVLMASIVGSILLALGAQHGVVQLTPFALAATLPFLWLRYQDQQSTSYA